MGDAWPLKGRTPELGVIAAVLAEANEHSGVAIAGRAGVGKSRLAREAVAAASEAGWAVRWVVGTATAQKFPLGSFAQWTDGGDGNPLRLVQQVISTLTPTEAQGRALIAVDDAHRLDDLSAFVLHQVVLQGVAKVIATLRSGEPAPDAVTAMWKDGHLRRLELQPLSRPESDALLADVLGGPVSTECSDRIWRLTQGNVLFLRQLVEQEISKGRLVSRNGQWQLFGKVAVSPSLTDLVELQIGAVSEPVREVVDLVAVAEPIERACLSSLVAQDVMEEAERRGLIAVSSSTPSVDVVQVGHPLYGEVRLEQSGPLRLRRLRGRVANAMTALETTNPVNTVRLGLLWLESDLEPDAQVFCRAAREALVLTDLELAERLAAAAMRAGAGADAPILRAHALILLNRGGEARRVLDSLNTEELSESALSKVISLRAANLLWPLGRPQESWDVIEEGLSCSHGRLADHLRAFRLMQLAVAARPAEVITVVDSIDRSQLDGWSALIAIWAEVIALGDIGRPQRAAAVSAEGYVLASGSTEAAFQGLALTEFHVSAMLFGGHIPEALAAAEHTYCKFCNGPGLSRSVATAVMGMAALGSGDLVKALLCLHSAVSDFEADGGTTGVFYRFMIVHAEALARSGDVDAALQALEKIHSQQHPAFALVESDRLLTAAWVAAARGRITEARENAACAAEFARSHQQLAREVMCMQVAVQLGDTRGAERLTELAGLVEGPRAPLAAKYAQALMNDDGDALWTISHAFEAIGDRFAAADAAAHASVAYGRTKRRGAALSACGRAHHIMESCGGATSPAVSAAESPLPLTMREREIVTLVSEGLSNKEIASTLSTSVRTVEGHIYRVTSKLGVNSRTELSHIVRQCDGEVNHRGSHSVGTPVSRTG